MGHILLLFVMPCDTCQNLQEDLQDERWEYEHHNKTENWKIMYLKLKTSANQNRIIYQWNNNFKIFLYSQL